MRTLLTIVTLAVLSTGIAHAQTTAPAASKGYVEAVAQSAFGDATSQSYGVEAGVSVWKNLQVFGEFGQVRNTAPAALGTAAQVIAGFIGQSQTGATFSVRQPVSFGAGGVKYLIPVTGVKVQPYVLGAFGMAKVSKDVAFFVGGSDVTAQLATYGVVLGTDLSGEFTKPMLTFGGGLVWPVWHQVIVDFQFRSSHISAEDTDSTATTVNRAGIGIGIRF